MRSTLLKIVLPWLITVVALYFAFRAVNLGDLLSHIGDADSAWLSAAVGLTALSYILRARRWEFLFFEKSMTLWNAWRVLILGFFMNNVLPARAGEFVRAHLGSKVSGQRRTVVLATVASERLADGLTLSVMFVLCAFAFPHGEIPVELSYVAYLFLAAALGVGVVLFLRAPLFNLIDRMIHRLDHKAADYTLSRIRIFIDGLAPLFSLKRIPLIVLWSIVIWSVELGAFMAVGKAYNVYMPLQYFVFFLVTVNFSSLIPAAPGGIGVIEAITSALLITLGVDRELALAMVLTQHVIQYIVVGVPGAIVMATWSGKIRLSEEQAEESESAQP